MSVLSSALSLTIVKADKSRYIFLQDRAPTGSLFDKRLPGQSTNHAHDSHDHVNCRHNIQEKTLKKKHPSFPWFECLRKDYLSEVILFKSKIIPTAEEKKIFLLIFFCYNNYLK